jgi:hypothetical protein
MTDDSNGPVVIHGTPEDVDPTESTNPTVPVTDDAAKQREMAEPSTEDHPHAEPVMPNPAHPVDENPLDHVGDEQPDPWGQKEA